MNTILGLGFILTAGLFSAKLIKKIKFPAVTAYLLLGILIGPALFKLVPAGILNSSGLISNIVLGIKVFTSKRWAGRWSYYRGTVEKIADALVGLE